MEPTELKHMAERCGWRAIKTKHPTLISFRNGDNKIRMNVYFTTGTVGVCIPKKRETFKYKQSKYDIQKLFESVGEGI